MKNILVAVLFFVSLLINSAHARDTVFDLHHGKLDVGCIYVIGLPDNYNGVFYQRGRSSNFELTEAEIATDDDCPPMLIEGEACEITEDISGSVTITYTEGDMDCNDCTTMQTREGIVNADGECVDLVG